MKLSDFTDEEIVKEIKERNLEGDFDDIGRFGDHDIIEAVDDRRLEDSISCNCSISDYGDDNIVQEVRSRNIEDEVIGDQYTHAKLCDLFGVNRYTPVKELLKLLKSKLMAAPETARAFN